MNKKRKKKNSVLSRDEGRFPAQNQAGPINRRERITFYQRSWFFILLIFFLALTVRITFIYQQSLYNPVFHFPAMDEAYHVDWATALEKGESFSSSFPYFRAPLYPYFLSFLFSIIGDDLLIIRMIQAFIGAGTCILVIFLARYFISDRLSYIAGLILAFYSAFVYYDNQLLIPVLFLPLIVSFFLATFIASRQERWSLWFLSGLLLGLAAVARPNILVIVPFLFWFSYNRRKLWQKNARTLGAIFFALLLIIGSATLRNGLKSGDWVLISSQAGVNFYIGNNPLSDGKTAIVPGTRPDWWGGYEDSRGIAQKTLGKDCKDSEISRYWLSRAYDFIQQNPWSWLKLMARKGAYLFGSHEISNNQSINFFGKYSPIYQFIPISFGLVASFGITGIMLLLMRRERLTLFFVLSFLGYSLSIIIFFVNARYRLPLIPFLVVGLCYLISYCLEVLKKKQLNKFVFPAITFVLVVCLVHRPGQPGNDFSQDYFALGVSFQEQGQEEKAISQYRQALEINPKFESAWYNLGILYLKMNDNEQSRKALEAVLSIDPDDWRARFYLAKIELLSGNARAAVESFKKVISHEPDYAESYYYLGHAYMALGQFLFAGQSFNACLEKEPDHLNAQIYKAVSLLEIGYIEEGKEILTKLSSKFPTNELISRYLALVK